MMVSLDLRSCSPSEATSLPSMLILPWPASRMRNMARLRLDLPAPVRPTSPTCAVQYSTSQYSTLQYSTVQPSLLPGRDLEAEVGEDVVQLGPVLGRVAGEADGALLRPAVRHLTNQSSVWRVLTNGMTNQSSVW